MTRLAIIFVLTFTVSGALFYAWKTKTNQDEALEARAKYIESLMNAQTKITVVCAIRDIPQGGIITGASLDTREVLQSTLPEGPVLLQEVAIGKKARWRIKKDQVLGHLDLDPDPGRGQFRSLRRFPSPEHERDIDEL